MKVEELRTGNIVRLNTEIIIITSIDSTFNSVWAKKNSDGNTFGGGLSKIEPIPLDKEWLKKSGFIQDENTVWWHKDGYHVGAFQDKNIFCKDGCSSNYHDDVKFVHQLQNLYYVLTGEELTINEI